MVLLKMIFEQCLIDVIIMHFTVIQCMGKPMNLSNIKNNKTNSSSAISNNKDLLQLRKQFVINWYNSLSNVVVMDTTVMRSMSAGQDW